MFLCHDEFDDHFHAQQPVNPRTITHALQIQFQNIQKLYTVVPYPHVFNKIITTPIVYAYLPHHYSVYTLSITSNVSLIWPTYSSL